nr:hypothetical protein [Lachnospiraceae bacterium]
MPELLIVLVIMAVLAGVGVIATQSIMKNMRGTKLDAMAQALYESSGSRLSEVFAYGENDILKKSHTTGLKKADRNVYYYITSADKNAGGDVQEAYEYFLYGKDGATASGPSWMDETILHNSWVIEFDPETCLPANAFYSDSESLGGFGEKGTSYPGGALAEVLFGADGIAETLKTSVEERVSNNIGWYGGDTPTAGFLNQVGEDYKVSVSLDNAERLTAYFDVLIPSVVRKNGDGDDEEQFLDVTKAGSFDKQLLFDVELRDAEYVSGENKHVWKGTYKLTGSGTSFGLVNVLDASDNLFGAEVTYSEIRDAGLELKGGELTWKMDIDSLEDPATTAFQNRFANNPTNDTIQSKQPTGLIPGEDVTLILWVHTAEDYLPTIADYNKENSLFESAKKPSEGTEAQLNVAYGRHLQNLDLMTSGVGNLDAASPTEQKGIVLTG